MTEAAQRLTGSAPGAGFVEDLRRRFATDAFTRDILIGVIADVAFGGRLPTHRPLGASWDRGLTWWAAAIAGTTPGEFEARTETQATQRRLFDAEEPQAAASMEAGGAALMQPKAVAHLALQPADSVVSVERRMLVAALRELLAGADGDQVPASAVRQLLAALESGPQAEQEAARRRGQ
ncbi:MAG: hypothetical protein M3387_10775 [Actinomycetota bacterium]|nr:hypothetical protein [Actinomycetota bacterium]